MSDSQAQADSTTANSERAEDDISKVELLERIDEQAQQIEQLQEDVEYATQKANNAMERLLNTRQENRELRDELAKAADERDKLRKDINENRDRTDLLETVKRAGGMKKEHRAAVLIQTLYNEARAKQERDTKDKATASMDYNKAEGALGGGVSRPQIYATFERAEELVDDRDVVKYVKEDRTSPKNSRLVVTLEEGDVPNSIAGHEIEEPEV